jgi:hypothetical protein
VNIRNVLVFDQKGHIIYDGAPIQGFRQAYWLGDDHIVSLGYSLTGRDPRLRSYFETTVFIIDPFARTYTSFVPKHDSLFYVGDDPNMLYQITYDGRYLVVGDAFDFETQQVVKRKNYKQLGIPSSTSHNFLMFDYSTQLHNFPTDRIPGPHPVQVYNLDTDTLTQVSSLDIDRPIATGTLANSWSPDETQWAYMLDVGNEKVSHPVTLLNLISGKTTSTCLELGAVDLAWSRDSRYLALQGVLEGQDMEKSFGVYIYDTQTSEIYEVYQGHANIIGWMANPKN